MSWWVCWPNRCNANTHSYYHLEEHSYRLWKRMFLHRDALNAWTHSESSLSFVMCFYLSFLFSLPVSIICHSFVTFFIAFWMSRLVSRSSFIWLLNEFRCIQMVGSFVRRRRQRQRRMGACLNTRSTTNGNGHLWWSCRWCSLSSRVCSPRSDPICVRILTWIPFICRAVVRELIETEEEFGRDLLHVVDNYIKTIDNTKPPKVVTDNKELIFGNFKQIAQFHNT